MPLVHPTYYRGFLWWVGDNIWIVRGSLEAIANSIRSLPRYGPPIAAWLVALRDICYGLTVWFHDADVFIWRIAREVDKLIWEGGIATIVGDLIEAIEWEIEDLYYEMIHMVGRALGFEGGILDYPHMWPYEIMSWYIAGWKDANFTWGGWVLVRIMEWNLDVYNWITNPWIMLLWEGGKVLGIPEIWRLHLQMWPYIILTNLIDAFDPVMSDWRLWLDNQIRIHFPQLYTFIYNPLQWVRETLYWNYGVPWSVWTNWPWNFLEEAVYVIGKYVQLYWPGIQPTLSKITRYALEGKYEQ